MLTAIKKLTAILTAMQKKLTQTQGWLSRHQRSVFSVNTFIRFLKLLNWDIYFNPCCPASFLWPLAAAVFQTRVRPPPQWTVQRQWRKSSWRPSEEAAGRLLVRTDRRSLFTWPTAAWRPARPAATQHPEPDMVQAMNHTCFIMLRIWIFWDAEPTNILISAVQGFLRGGFCSVL